MQLVEEEVDQLLYKKKKLIYLLFPSGEKLTYYIDLTCNYVKLSYM